MFTALNYWVDHVMSCDTVVCDWVWAVAEEVVDVRERGLTRM